MFVSFDKLPGFTKSFRFHQGFDEHCRGIPHDERNLNLLVKLWHNFFDITKGKIEAKRKAYCLQSASVIYRE